MKTLALVITLALAVTDSFVQASAQDVEIKVSSAPLTSEQARVYRSFLTGYRKNPKLVLNLANITDVFQPVSDDSSCLRGFLQTSSPKEVHRFDDGFGKENHVNLVDPKMYQLKDPDDLMKQGKSVDDAVEEGFRSGLLTLSEIVFDAKHNHAALRFTYICGRLCGSSSTVIFVLRNGVWVRSNRYCGVVMY